MFRNPVCDAEEVAPRGPPPVGLGALVWHPTRNLNGQYVQAAVQDVDIPAGHYDLICFQYTALCSGWPAGRWLGVLWRLLLS